MPSQRSHLHLLRMLTERLERISADSVWAHRASGVRGSLLRLLEEGEQGAQPNPQTLSMTVAAALHILIQAAKGK